jgi:predicted ATPase with chaperone activity
MQTKSACGYSVHNLLLGPPGVGTSRLARRLTTILPDLTLAGVHPSNDSL